MLKAPPRHHHENLSEADRAHLKEMDRDMDSADAASDNSEDGAERRLRAVQRQGDLIAKGKVTTHLSDWLGFKAPQPAPVADTAPERAPAKQNAEADDGEAEAASLVTQAKAQLAAMERDDDAG